MFKELSTMIDWSEAIIREDAAQHAADTEFRRLMRDKYGIAETMAPEGDDE